MAIRQERKTVTSQNPGLIRSLWDDPDLKNMAQTNKQDQDFILLYLTAILPVVPNISSLHVMTHQGPIIKVRDYLLVVVALNPF